MAQGHGLWLHWFKIFVIWENDFMCLLLSCQCWPWLKAWRLIHIINTVLRVFIKVRCISSTVFFFHFEFGHHNDSRKWLTYKNRPIHFKQCEGQIKSHAYCRFIDKSCPKVSFSVVSLYFFFHFLCKIALCRWIIGANLAHLCWCSPSLKQTAQSLPS